MMHNKDTRENIIKNEFWMREEDIKALETFRDILYCKYAIREEIENRNCTVDMLGIASWGKKLEELRKDFMI